MNKFIIIALCSFMIATNVVGTSYHEDRCYDFKIRGFAFIPTGDRFKHIYGRAAGGIQAEITTGTSYEHLDLWVNVDGLFKHGHSIGLCNPTKVRIGSLSFGVKVPFEWGDCHRRIFYLGVGPSIAGIFIKNNSVCCGCENVSQGSGGLVVKSGVDWFVSERTFVDIFADYNYQPTRFECCTVNVGGLKVGLGLGSTF